MTAPATKHTPEQAQQVAIIRLFTYPRARKRLYTRQIAEALGIDMRAARARMHDLARKGSAHFIRSGKAIELGEEPNTQVERILDHVARAGRICVVEAQAMLAVPTVRAGSVLADLERAGRLSSGLERIVVGGESRMWRFWRLPEAKSA